jgi:hypothetical protein
MIPRRRLSPVLRHGDRHIAVLEEWTVSAWARGHRLGGSGEKRPLAILIGGADGLGIHGPDRRPDDTGGDRPASARRSSGVRVGRNP